MKQLLDHPIADLFPLATDDELAGLVSDIREHGQIEAIDLFEGKILDGRNRYRACVLARITPRFEEWQANGIAPQDYVVAKNLHRRHLTIAQRAALAVKLLPYEREEALHRKAEAGRSAAPGRPAGKDTPRPEHLSSKGEAAQKAAKKVGVGKTSVLAAELISKESPKTFKKMERGEISVTAAATEAGVGTGTYTRKQPKPQFTSEEIQASATAADNIHAAYFYTGMASNALPVFHQIPGAELDQVIAEAAQAYGWWKEILEVLRAQKASGNEDPA